MTYWHWTLSSVCFPEIQGIVPKSLTGSTIANMRRKMTPYLLKESEFEDCSVVISPLKQKLGLSLFSFEFRGIWNCELRNIFRKPKLDFKDTPPPLTLLHVTLWRSTDVFKLLDLKYPKSSVSLQRWRTLWMLWSCRRTCRSGLVMVGLSPKLVFMRVPLTNGVIIHRCCKHKSRGYHQ